MLSSTIRSTTLTALDVKGTSTNVYGLVFEIEGPIRTPSGPSVRFCSVWQIDTGTDVPRFEFFDMAGNTVAVATLPASALRQPTAADRPAIRQLSA